MAVHVHGVLEAMAAIERAYVELPTRVCDVLVVLVLVLVLVMVLMLMYIIC